MERSGKITFSGVGPWSQVGPDVPCKWVTIQGNPSNSTNVRVGSPDGVFDEAYPLVASQQSPPIQVTNMNQLKFHSDTEFNIVNWIKVTS